MVLLFENGFSGWDNFCKAFAGALVNMSYNSLVLLQKLCKNCPNPEKYISFSWLCAHRAFLRRNNSVHIFSIAFLPIWWVFARKSPGQNWQKRMWDSQNAWNNDPKRAKFEENSQRTPSGPTWRSVSRLFLHFFAIIHANIFHWSEYDVWSQNQQNSRKLGCNHAKSW